MCESHGEAGFLGFPVTDCVSWCLRRWSWWLSWLVARRTAAHLVSEISDSLKDCLLKFAPGSEGMYINACQTQWKPPPAHCLPLLIASRAPNCSHSSLCPLDQLWVPGGRNELAGEEEQGGHHEDTTFVTRFFPTGSCVASFR